MEIQETLLAQITGGEARGRFVLNKISIDSRTLKKEDIFLAFKGPKFNGHDYIEDAIKKGCSAVIIDYDYFYTRVNKWLEISFYYKFYNFLIVKDTNQALIDIAKYCREKFSGKIIGITGSVGKTTLKDMLSFVLEDQLITTSTLGNFNNQVGMALSLINMNKHASVGVFEMGMSTKGEISYLTNILKPDIAIITEISNAHLEFFSSLDHIAEAKAEIIEGLSKENGILVLNYDSDYYDFLKNKAIAAGISSIHSYSLADSRASVYGRSSHIYFNNVSSFGADVEVSIFKQQQMYHLRTLAKHNIMLANAVLSVVYILGLNLSKAAIRLGKFQITSGRGKVSNLKITNSENNKINITMIDDSYNASPVSMVKAIETLHHLKNYNKVLVLGEMLELGQQSSKEHLKLQEYIVAAKPMAIITMGKGMQKLHELLKEKCLSNKLIKHFEDANEASKFLLSFLENGDLVFLKGSYGSFVHKVAEHLYNKEEKA